MIKGWSQWNMGERYPGGSQPSCREARYEKFRAAAAATREPPPPPSLCHFRYRQLLQPVFWERSSPPSPHFQALSPSCQYSAHRPCLYSNFLISISFFLPFMSLLLCQAGRDLTLINKSHLPRRCGNKAQTQKIIIDFFSTQLGSF